MKLEKNGKNSEIGPLFQEYTKYKHDQGYPDMVMQRKTPDPEKSYDSDPIELPTPLKLEKEITEVIKARRSRRNYHMAENLSLEELSTLLYYTAGVREKMYPYPYHMAPSAGARHPLDLYLLVNRVDSLEKALYYYKPSEHSVYQINQEKNNTIKIENAALGQDMVSQSAVTFIWGATIYRATWKYKNRGYRYVYLDAGHACQNLYLITEALGFGCCAIAAFDDDKLNQLLGLDGEKEFTLYIATVGPL